LTGVMSNQMIYMVADMRMTVKHLKRTSKKLVQEQKKETALVKKALQDNKPQVAQIHATNAIFKKNESVKSLKLASRIEALTSKLASAAEVHKLSMTLIPIMQNLNNSLNVEQTMIMMNKLERQMEDVDIKTETIEGAIETSTATTTPEDDVRALMQQVADENGLELEEELDAPKKETTQTTSQAEEDQDELLVRLNNLRNS
jgi:charged multivesicular body protein 1